MSVRRGLELRRMSERGFPERFGRVACGREMGGFRWDSLAGGDTISAIIYATLLEALMRTRAMRVLAIFGAAVTFCGVALAQNGQPGQAPNMPAHDKAASGPAPVKDINGVWAGSPLPRLMPAPPMTPAGQAAFQLNKSFQGQHPVAVSDSNDAMLHCDPLGFPRDVLFETRGIKFVQIPKETLQLFQYQRVWREIWTDGRALPSGVGGDAPDAPDPRYYGYSVGHWDGDTTFVVNTVGMDERPWVDEFGHPKSVDAKVEERYHRLDHDSLEYTVTIDDPKMYTKPFQAITFDLKWNPKEEFEEQLCIPTDMETYMKTIANPAGAHK